MFHMERHCWNTIIIIIIIIIIKDKHNVMLLTRLWSGYYANNSDC